MDIRRKEQFNIEVILNWQNWEILEKGETIGDRYDGQNKLLIHRIFPCNPYDYESKLNSLQQQEYAEFSRETMDIDIYIPHGLLRDVRFSASNFNLNIGNLKIIPNPENCENMNIRVLYPGSLKYVNIPSYFENLSAMCS